MKGKWSKGCALLLSLLLTLGFLPVPARAAGEEIEDVELNGTEFTVTLAQGTQYVDLDTLLSFLRESSDFSNDYTYYSYFNYYTAQQVGSGTLIANTDLAYERYYFGDYGDMVYIRLYDSATQGVWYSIHFVQQSAGSQPGEVALTSGSTYTFSRDDFAVVDIPYADSRVKIYFNTLPTEGTLYYDGDEVARYDEVPLSNAGLLTYKDRYGESDYFTFSLRYYASGSSTYTTALISATRMDIVIESSTYGAGSVAMLANTTYTFDTGDFQVIELQYSVSKVYIRINSLPAEGSLYYDDDPVGVGEEIPLSDAEYIAYENETGQSDSFRFGLVYYSTSSSSGTTLLYTKTMEINIVGTSAAGSVTLRSKGTYTFGSGDFEVTNIPYNYAYVYICINTLPGEGTLYYNGIAVTRYQEICLKNASLLSYQNETGNDDSFQFALRYYPSSSSSYTSLVTSQTMRLTLTEESEAGLVSVQPRSTYTFTSSDFEVVDISYAYSKVYVVFSALPSQGTLYYEGEPMLRGDQIPLSLISGVTYQNETGKSDSFVFALRYYPSLSGNYTALATSESFTIQVAGSADSAGSVIVSPNQPFAFAVSDFEVTDIPYSYGDVMVVFLSLPAHGTLYYDGEQVARQQEIALNNADLLTYEESDGGADSFRFALRYYRTSTAYTTIAADETMTISVNDWSDIGPLVDDVYIPASSRSQSYYFEGTDFSYAYDPAGYASMQSVVVQTLPDAEKGKLYLNDTAVSLGQKIPLSGLDGLYFEKAGTFADPAVFNWYALDKNGVMSNIARVIITTEEHKPELHSFTLAAARNTTLTLNSYYWQRNYFDLNGDALAYVKITSLPSATAGVLYLNQAEVQTGDEILLKNLSRLTFKPSAGYIGSASFEWNACDAEGYAEEDAECTIVIASTVSVSASDFTVAPDDQGNFAFTFADFNAGFLHPANLPAALLKINTLPLSTYGTLYYKNSAVKKDDVIPLSSISALRFEAKSSLAGGVSFTYTLSADGLAYSDVATVTMAAFGTSSKYTVAADAADKTVTVTMAAATPDKDYAISAGISASAVADIYKNAGFTGGTLIINMPSAAGTTALIRTLTLSTDVFDAVNQSKISRIRVTDGIVTLELRLSKFESYVQLLDTITVTLSNHTVTDTSSAMNAGRAREIGLRAGNVNMNSFPAGAVSLTVSYAPTVANQDKAVIVQWLSSSSFTPMPSSNMTVSSTQNGIATGTITASLPSPGVYVPIVNAVSYSDVSSSDWYATYVIRLSARGIINGMGSGSFAPAGTLTRAQFIKLLVYSLDLNTASAACTFTDVTATDWYYAALSSAVSSGIISNGGAFRPNDPVTREDMCLFAYRAVIAAGGTFPASGTPGAFSDESSISSSCLAAVKAMQGAGVINGYTDGAFKPKGSSTRAEASKVIQLIVELYYGK